MSLVGLLKMLITWLEGTGYEPLTNEGVVIIMLAVVFSAVARLVMRRESISLGQRIFPILRQAYGVFKNSNQYAKPIRSGV
jgi:hypothetical protein